jgi:excisionase family DNA binding protein
MDPVLLRIQETATLLKVSKWTVYRWIGEGRLRATKIGRGSLRVFRTSLNGLIEGAQVERQGTQDSLPGPAAHVQAVGKKRKKK